MELLPEVIRPECTINKHCVIDMHHVKSLDAFGRLLHRVYGARSRHNGSFQLVWCTDLPVLIAQMELLHEVIGPECTINKHCVIDMHHVKSLDAFGRLLHRVYGARSRHNGSFQLVWCTDLPVSIAPMYFFYPGFFCLTFIALLHWPVMTEVIQFPCIGVAACLSGVDWMGSFSVCWCF